MLPAVALEIIAAIDDEGSSAGHIVKILQREQSLAARVLAVANSPIYGRREHVEDLAAAVVTLGDRTVRALTITFAVRGLFKDPPNVDLIGESWRTSVAVALLSQQIGESAGLGSDNCYTAGLLHNIGSIMLMVGYPDEYVDSIAVAEERGLPLRQCERALFDIDYCAAGAWLLNEWGVPEIFQRVAAEHDDRDPTSPKIVRIVEAAVGVAGATGCHTYAMTPAPLEDALSHPLIQDRAAVERLLDSLEKQTGLAVLE